jgi:hypothetical protein
MAKKLLKEVYKTPRTQVRGVFLCENVADTLASVRGNIVQEDWDPLDNTDIGLGADPQGNITFHFD